jgi:hypothetical protein
MASLSAMTSDQTTPEGEFDPANQVEVKRLLFAATRPYAAALRNLSPRERSDVLEEAEAEAIIAALEYDPNTARTTKWKTAANRANTIVRKYFRDLPRRPQNETDVLEGVRSRIRGDEDPEGDSGELDLTVLAVEDDDDNDGEYEAHDLTDQEYEAEREQWIASLGVEDSLDEDASGVQIEPLDRGEDEDAEHFEMRRHLISTAVDPDRTILQRWTGPAAVVGHGLGLSGDAVRQRKTRLRKIIDAEIAKPGPLHLATDSSVDI